MLLPLFAESLDREKLDIDGKIEDIATALTPPAPLFKNPFMTTAKPVFAKAKPAIKRKLELQSVVANRALISSNWYQVGQSVDGWLVKAVFLDFVVIKKGTTEERLTMNESRYKNNNITKASAQ